MYPVLFKIGDFPIHTYGFLIAIGFLLCVYVSKLEARRQGLPVERIVDLGFWALLIGLIGCRVLYIITRWSDYWPHPIEMLYVWEGGLVFFAGPLVNIPFFIWYTRKYDLNPWKVLDIGATAVPLAHAFGRLGCLSAGCCYGKPTGGEWGIKLYTELVDPDKRGVYLHPTQLYEAVALFILFFILRWMRFHKKFDGQLALTYLVSYSVIRAIIEIFRGDEIRGFVIDNILSTSQFIAILVVIAALATAAVFRIKRKREACLQSPA